MAGWDGRGDRDIADLVAARAGLAPVRHVARVPEAGVNRVLRVTHWDGLRTAVRLNVRDVHETKWTRESAALRLVRERVPDLPVPRVLYVDESRTVVPWAVEVQSWEGGVRAETMPPHLRPAEALGRMVALLHRVEVPRFGWLSTAEDPILAEEPEQRWAGYVWQGIEGCLEDLQSAGIMTADRAEELVVALRSRYAGALAGLPPTRPRLVHGDLHWDNVLVDPNTGRIRAVLDWEWCLGAAAGLETAMTTRPVRHSPRFWHGYRSVTPQGPDPDPGRGLRLTLYRAWRALDVGASWARAGTTPAWLGDLKRVWEAAALLRTPS